jgi:hypothetical protein
MGTQAVSAVSAGASAAGSPVLKYCLTLPRVDGLGWALARAGGTACSL